MNLSLRTALAAAAILACTSSQAVTLIGLNSQNQISRIDTANVGAAVNMNITGLAAGDRLVGIDTRPKDGKVYGVSLSNQLYTVNEMTGAATLVAALSAPVIQANLGYGIDFNPVADFGTGASLRLVSSAGSNFAINAATGVVGNAANTIAAGFSGVAYTNAIEPGNIILAVVATFVLVFPSQQRSLEEARQRMVATLLGAAMALLLLFCFTIVGNLSVMVLLLFLAGLYFGTRMMTGREPPMVYQFGFSAMLALVGGSLTSSEPGYAVLTRVVLTLAGAMAAVLLTALLEALLEALFVPEVARRTSHGQTGQTLGQP